MHGMVGEMDVRRRVGGFLTCQLISCAGALMSHVLQWMQLVEFVSFSLPLGITMARERERDLS